MELRHLRYFLELAKTLHYGVAAENLNISTPTLSVQINQLEEELGAPLFYRTQRKVELTQIGEIFQQEAHETLQHAEQAKARVRSAARGERGYIRVGYVASALLSGVLTRLLTCFSAGAPDISINARESAMDTLATQVSERTIDVAFVRGPVPLPADVGYIEVEQDYFALALPDNHPLLAQEQPIEPVQLKGETFILPEQVSGTVTFAQRGGFILSRSWSAGSLNEVLANVALGNGVAVIPAILVTQLKLPGITYREIPGTVIPSSIWFLYRKRERTPAVNKLVRMIERSP